MFLDAWDRPGELFEDVPVERNPGAGKLLEALEEHPVSSDAMAAFMATRVTVCFRVDPLDVANELRLIAPAGAPDAAPSPGDSETPHAPA